MKLENDLKELKRAIETYSQLKQVLNIEMAERCKDVIIDRTFRNKYGLEITDLSSTVIQLFYDIGKEDAIKELKEKL